MLSGLRMSWSVSTISNSGSSRAREKCFGGGVPDIGRRARGHVGTGVVAGLVSGQGDESDQGQRTGRRENRARPADDGGPDPPPSAGSDRALGVEDACLAAKVRIAGPRVSAAKRATRMPNAAGMPRLWKYGRRVKLRQATAPATVSPDPKTMCVVP